MPAILSIDLACRRSRDIGICVLHYDGVRIDVEFVRQHWEDCGSKLDPRSLAETIAQIARRHQARLVLIDGPQAWKDPRRADNDARVCEMEAATQGKTGSPGTAKPWTFLTFSIFSIAVFDRLGELGWPRLSQRSSLHTSKNFALEMYPTAAWKAIGLRPLPSKSNAEALDVKAKFAELSSTIPIAVLQGDTITHDELQAIVGGLAGVAAEGYLPLEVKLVGVPPVEQHGRWYEGYIVLPSRMQEDEHVCSDPEKTDGV